jgi:hypothetical protein
MPAAMQANRRSPAQAYPRRCDLGKRRKLSRKTASSSVATIHISVGGQFGVARGGASGISIDRVVINVAVQVPGVVLVPAVGVQVAAVPRLLAPFLNCTVPVGPALFMAPVTVAVKVTLPPEAMDVTLAFTAIVVDCAPAFTVTVTALEGPELE